MSEQNKQYLAPHLVYLKLINSKQLVTF